MSSKNSSLTSGGGTSAATVENTSSATRKESKDTSSSSRSNNKKAKAAAAAEECYWPTQSSSSLPALPGKVAAGLVGGRGMEFSVNEECKFLVGRIIYVIHSTVCLPGICPFLISILDTILCHI